MTATRAPARANASQGASPGAARSARAIVAAVIGAAATVVALAVIAGCGDDDPVGGDLAEATTLYPAANPFGPADPLWSKQPHRDKPQQVVLTPDGATALVSLPGTVDAPSSFVAIVDVKAGALRGRVAVGTGPFGLAMHPSGRWLVVTLRTSNYLAVVDVQRRAVVQRLATDFYTVGAAFSPDGATLVVANRWRDAAALWRVQAGEAGLRVLARGPWLPVATNPRDVAVSADGRWAAIGALTGLEVAVLDVAKGSVHQRVTLGAPSSGVAFVGPWLVATTQSASTHHAATWGPDGDGDGAPGDGTPNVNFQDLQNELAVIDPASGAVVARATSDTIAGRDYRDVDPADTARGGDLLPPAAARIVGGALPEGIAAGPDADTLVVGYSASNQLQRFRVDAATGALSALGPAWLAGGHQPMGLAVAGGALVVAHRLSETVAIFDAASGALRATVVVGSVIGGPFPATDAEIGELVNFVTAPFTVDGDQSCSHCHREEGNVNKAFSMPLLAFPAMASRMTMAYRGAADSRPWFHEAAMNEDNFLPVLNEFARIENFCCTDYTLWGKAGPPSDCVAKPPAQCLSAPNPSSSDGFVATRAGREPWLLPRPTAHADRDSFVRAAMKSLAQREVSYGDGLFFENPLTGDRQPLVLDMNGITRALGIFLLAQPRLLPNPNPRTAAARRGEALFHRPEVGCATCHPGPGFALSEPRLGQRPEGALPLRMAPVVSPMRAADGTNLDLLSEGFVATFPQAEMDACSDVLPTAWCAKDPSAGDKLREVRFGTPSLRGLWDRAPRMLHHGQARSLREVLCTPGHPALRPGEVGRNERDGMPDTHGGTSHLSPGQIADLEAFLETL